jgi:hypothetical protein
MAITLGNRMDRLSERIDNLAGTLHAEIATLGNRIDGLSDSVHTEVAHLERRGLSPSGSQP